MYRYRGGEEVRERKMSLKNTRVFVDGRGVCVELEDGQRGVGGV